MSILSGIFAGTKKMDSGTLPIRSYVPANPDGPFPYSAADLTPMDAGDDSGFYAAPRFVTHIDDNAINTLRTYYNQVLPRKGRILDFCSSWISHYPREVAEAASSGQVEVVGTGMNEKELEKNRILKHWSVQNLNEDPEVRLPASAEGKLDASTCVVSIDYLTKPVDVLQSIRRQTNEGGKVHLIISNRCFPTKVVGRWLKVDEEERLNMVGDYLWWSGWRKIEIQTLVEGSFMRDPLWVVRGENEDAEQAQG
jgi:SAM-dependent methyltransferase